MHACMHALTHSLTTHIHTHSPTQGIIEAIPETGKGSNPSKSNAAHAIIFEAIALALCTDSGSMLSSSVGALGRFLATKEPNVK
jgi:hypothetical protein